MVWNVHLYFILIGSRIRSQLQYRVSFMSDVAANFVASLADLAVLLVLFGHTRILGGWDVGEVAILYGLSATTFALAELIGGGFDHFAQTIRTGNFDTLLVRPVGVFLQVLSCEFMLKRLGRMSQGLVVLWVAFRWKQAVLAPWQWLMLTGAILCGALFYISLLLVQATSCFWAVESLEIFNILTYGGHEMLSYPMDIYPGWLKRFFVSFLPMAFINYVPAGKVLGKGGLAGALPHWAGWLPPLVGVTVFMAARAVWEYGVRHYQSTGS